MKIPALLLLPPFSHEGVAATLIFMSSVRSVSMYVAGRAHRRAQNSFYTAPAASGRKPAIILLLLVMREKDIHSSRHQMCDTYNLEILVSRDRSLSAAHFPPQDGAEEEFHTCRMKSLHSLRLVRAQNIYLRVFPFGSPASGLPARGRTTPARRTTRTGSLPLSFRPTGTVRLPTPGADGGTSL